MLFRPIDSGLVAINSRDFSIKCLDSFHHSYIGVDKNLFDHIFELFIVTLAHSLTFIVQITPPMST